MNRLQPIKEADANEKTKEIYELIKKSLNVKTVPMFFKYIANSPEFLEYAWQIVNPAISDPSFSNARDKMEDLAKEMMEVIYSPSQETSAYVNYISEQERKVLLESVTELIRVNASLMIISIAIRESLKGFYLKETNFLIANGSERSDIQEKDLTEVSREIALEDLNLSLTAIARYPDFYDLVGKDMLLLMKTEKYLKVRVEFERIIQMLIEQLNVKIQFEYKATMEILYKTNSARDIIFLINSVFPSQVPHNLLTSAGMWRSLTSSLAIANII